MSDDLIFVVNAGSSSIKAALYKGDELVDKTQLNDANPEGLIDKLVDWVEAQAQDKPIQAFGHRVVHGGNEFYGPTLLDETVKTKLKALTFLDPQHLPNALKIIDVLERKFPQTKQIACFDTAFFHDLPRIAQIIPLPRKYESIGLRKYGFHGLSYQSILEKLTNEHNVDVTKSNIVCAHLGSGVSLAAIKDSKPVDTTMAFTPASGVPMSTRSGNIDPGIPSFLEHTNGITLQEFTRLANNESGLLGVSETTADMYTLLQQEAEDHRSKEAIDLFCYEVKKSIGAFGAAMGGIDILVFAGGIGEKASKIRQQICKGLDYLGITVDQERNKKNEATIHSESGNAAVYVIHSDEEAIIVNQILKHLHSSNN